MTTQSHHFRGFFPLLSSFLWKIENNNDLWLSSSSPPFLVLTLLKHENDGIKLLSLFFLFSLCHSCERQKTNDNLWLSSSSPLYVFAPCRHKDNNIKPSSLCLFYSLCCFMKDRRYQQSQSIVLFASSCYCSIQTQKMMAHVIVFVFFLGLHRFYERRRMTTITNRHHLHHLLFSLLLDMNVIIFMFFCFWPSSFLWKIEDDNNHNNHKLSSSSLSLILVPLDTEDDNTNHHFCFFSFGLHHSYER
jgi:hypothetical protein